MTVAGFDVRLQLFQAGFAFDWAIDRKVHLHELDHYELQNTAHYYSCIIPIEVDYNFFNTRI